MADEEQSEPSSGLEDVFDRLRGELQPSAGTATSPSPAEQSPAESGSAPPPEVAATGDAAASGSSSVDAKDIPNDPDFLESLSAGAPTKPESPPAPEPAPEAVPDSLPSSGPEEDSPPAADPPAVDPLEGEIGSRKEDRPVWTPAVRREWEAASKKLKAKAAEERAELETKLETLEAKLAAGPDESAFEERDKRIADLESRLQKADLFQSDYYEATYRKPKEEIIAQLERHGAGNKKVAAIVEGMKSGALKTLGQVPMVEGALGYLVAQKAGEWIDLQGRESEAVENWQAELAKEKEHRRQSDADLVGGMTRRMREGIEQEAKVALEECMSKLPGYSSDHAQQGLAAMGEAGGMGEMIRRSLALPYAYSRLQESEARHEALQKDLAEARAKLAEAEAEISRHAASGGVSGSGFPGAPNGSREETGGLDDIMGRLRSELTGGA